MQNVMHKYSIQHHINMHFCSYEVIPSVPCIMFVFNFSKLKLFNVTNCDPKK